MKKGDLFKVRSANYHYFDDGEIVEFTGEYFIETPRYRNKKGTVQSILDKDVRPFYNDGQSVFDDELDKTIEATVRTEHKPRKTDGFIVAITEEALKDDIPFIIDAYYTANLSLRETGALLGVDEKTIRRRMSKHGVPTRTVSQALRAKYSM